ncbi:MAG: carboxypeptidase M32 [Phycisphaerae bacterium]|nr:carboxypeptidase M32 [Phycisphaerae bacterium]
MTPQRAYDELLRLSRDLNVFASCADLLEWDEETFMPPGAVAHRGEQRAALAGLLHDRAVDPRWNDLLAAVEGSALVADPDSPIAATVRELRREHDRQVRLPRRLVEEQARVTTLAQRAWTEAREESDFSRLLPHLQRIVALAREQAAVSGHPGPAYDALLDHYEPGATGQAVASLMASLGAALRPLVQAIAAKRRPRAALLKREFPVDRQRLFAQAVAAALGFDLERGRLDIGAHPFCIALGPGDTRMAVRFSDRAFAEGFFFLLHEVGHGLYEQGLDTAHAGTPLGRPASIGLHESQARLWENQIGRGLPFWKHFFPRLKNVFPEALGTARLDAFHAAINRIEVSPLRAQADELTYNLHIWVRFDLERDMVEGRLDPKDLPEAWRAAYRARLGVEPASDADGCLQDGHWAEGLLGYFPTYTLGNVYAAQLIAAARRDLPDLDDAMARGDFSPLLLWLRAKVHVHGQRFRPDALIQRIAGGPPDHAPLVRALDDKYRTLYNL